MVQTTGSTSHHLKSNSNNNKNNSNNHVTNMLEMQNPSCFLYGPFDARFEEKKAPEIEDAHDVIVRIAYTGVCGSDVHAPCYRLRKKQRLIQRRAGYIGAFLESWRHRCIPGFQIRTARHGPRGFGRCACHWFWGGECKGRG